MPTLKRTDIELFYEIHGSGKPLVLIAGYTGDHTFWSLMLQKLTSNFQVVVFDNRAIGQTKDKNLPFTLETMAEDTMSLVEHLALEKPVILGHSMGGAIAQIIARNYADRIDKLIILNSAIRFSARTAKALESQLDCRKENMPFDLFINTALPWFFSNHFLAEPENIALLKQNIISNPFPQSVMDQTRQYNALPGFDSSQWIQKITIPSLVISSEEDIITLPTEGLELAEMIKNAQFSITPGAHSSPVEQPVMVCQLIEQFLNNK